MELRPEQEELIDRLRDGYRKGFKRQVLQFATGGGKTVIFSFITKGAASRGLRVIIGTHRAEILAQISRTLTEVGVPHGIISAGWPMRPFEQVQVASIPTLIRRFDRVRPPDLFVQDEVHHCVSKSWSVLFAQYAKALFLGVTATPARLDGRGLGEFYQNMVIGPSTRWLIDNGRLAKPRYFGAPTLDTTKLHKVAGDFNRSESAALVDKVSITGDAVEHYRRLCAGQTAIAFCISLKHAAHVCAQFLAGGVPAVVIDGTMARGERERILRDFAARRILVLVSVDLVSEGFDLPAVGAAILLRPTDSLALHLQQIGRSLRPAPGKTSATILDHVGNTLRHGTAEEEREWTLAGGAGKKAKEKPIANRQCPKCYAIFAMYLQECPECGEAVSAKPRVIDQKAGMLSEMTAADIEKRRAVMNRRMEEGRAGSLEALKKLGASRGYAPGWAEHRWAARQRKARDTTDHYETVNEPVLI